MLPKRPLTNQDIMKFITCTEVPKFRGVFMRDNLPSIKPWKNECMVINHDSIRNSGTHWTCYVKKDTNVFYFDSYGKLAPPLELIRYLGSNCNIYYNSKRYQEFDTIICGHLCLKFLYEFYENK